MTLMINKILTKGIHGACLCCLKQFEWALAVNVSGTNASGANIFCKVS